VHLHRVSPVGTSVRWSTATAWAVPPRSMSQTTQQQMLRRRWWHCLPSQSLVTSVLPATTAPAAVAPQLCALPVPSRILLVLGPWRSASLVCRDSYVRVSPRSIPQSSAQRDPSVLAVMPLPVHSVPPATTVLLDPLRSSPVPLASIKTRQDKAVAKHVWRDSIVWPRRLTRSCVRRDIIVPLVPHSPRSSRVRLAPTVTARASLRPSTVLHATQAGIAAAPARQGPQVRALPATSASAGQPSLRPPTTSLADCVLLVRTA
jgi:hypothetical protein